MTSLVVAPCSHEAARYAVTRWHYSRLMPKGKNVKAGVWEADNFVGVILFGSGVCGHLGAAYGLDQVELCELTRVALRCHRSPVSAIVAEALRFLRTQSPGIRLVVSFADPVQGHHGGIYQAGNWVYTGRSGEVTEYLVGGEWWHTRTAVRRAGTVGALTALTRTRPGKHRYLMPLDRAMRRRIAPLAKPYPSRGSGLDSEPLPVLGGGAGATPAIRSTPTTV
jgi:hypothetical protein